MLFKLETRLRRLVWRASNPVYNVFITSTVLSFFAMKALASSYGPADTHRRRVEADGTYAKRRFAEVNDNPLYRCVRALRKAARCDGPARLLRARGWRRREHAGAGVGTLTLPSHGSHRGRLGTGSEPRNGARLCRATFRPD
jgi:hypothetical protein